MQTSVTSPGERAAPQLALSQSQLTLPLFRAGATASLLPVDWPPRIYRALAHLVAPRPSKATTTTTVLRASADQSGGCTTHTVLCSTNLHVLVLYMYETTPLPVLDHVLMAGTPHIRTATPRDADFPSLSLGHLQTDAPTTTGYY